MTRPLTLVSRGLSVVVLLGASEVVVTGRTVVIGTPDTSWFISSSPIPLQRSVVHMQADMESDSMEDGEH